MAEGTWALPSASTPQDRMVSQCGSQHTPGQTLSNPFTGHDDMKRLWLKELLPCFRGLLRQEVNIMT